MEGGTIFMSTGVPSLAIVIQIPYRSSFIEIHVNPDLFEAELIYNLKNNQRARDI